MNAEPDFIKYQDYKTITPREAVEKTAEEKAKEDSEHKAFMKTMGPKVSDQDDDGETLEERKARINKAHAEQAAKPVPTSYLHEMHHEVDPKEDLRNRIGNLDCLRLSGAQILVATYIRPERKKSGLILTSNVREEDKFQGKCGLVLKRGPLAYKATEKLDFGGYEAKVGDWVWYRPMDGYALSVNGVHCRVLDDVEIKGDIDHPDVVV